MAQKAVNSGLALRKKSNIKVRQPLRRFSSSAVAGIVSYSGIIDLIKDELNVKRVEFVKGKGELSVEFDTDITQELKDEGLVRDIIRQIQEERKRLGTRLDEKVNVKLESWPKAFENYIKKKALVQTLQKGEMFSVNRV